MALGWIDLLVILDILKLGSNVHNHSSNGRISMFISFLLSVLLSITSTCSGLIPHYEPEQGSFLWGSAISEYQVSGAAICTDSNWSEWEPRLKEKSGDACQFWDRYSQDITLMKELGIKSLRFSVEWCKIEPEEGVFNQDALDHYKKFVDELLANNIIPMITLHHFVHPAWFEEKGGFERRENGVYFERFCAHVFEHLSDKVKLWCTINEPTVFAFQGYIRGVFPPGKTNFKACWAVLRNMMEWHTQTYYRLKSMKNGQDVQIGIVHQYLVFEPYGSWNLLERIPGWLFNPITNDAVLEFLKTGTFKGRHGQRYQAPEPKPFDFLGLNYYSRAVLKGQLSLKEPLIPACGPGEIMTDMPYGIYPQGFYNAIMDMNSIGVPLYITENGIADARDDKRALWIMQYIDALHQALEDGADVRGYYYWSLLDNFEWDMGYGMKFGLYEVDLETKKRRLREGSKAYQEIIASYA